MKMILSGSDWERFHKCMHRLVNFDFRGLHAEIGEYLIDSTKERFRSGKNPDGSSWPVSHRAKDAGGKTLMDTRRLYNSITMQASVESVVVGTNVIYATTHNPKNDRSETIIRARKAKALKFQISGKWAAKKEIHIPARRFLGINEDDVNEIQQIGLERIEEYTR